MKVVMFCNNVADLDMGLPSFSIDLCEERKVFQDLAIATPCLWTVHIFITPGVWCGKMYCKVVCTAENTNQFFGKGCMPENKNALPILNGII